MVKINDVLPVYPQEIPLFEHLLYVAQGSGEEVVPVFGRYNFGLIAYLAIYLFFLVVINADQWKAFWWMFF